MSRWERLKTALAPNYYRLHWLYIVVMTLLGAVAAYFIEGNVRFMDSFLVMASCISGTGLATVDITQWNWVSQAIMSVIMVVGSPVLMTLIPVYFRRRIFQKKYTKIQRKTLVEYKVLRSVFRIVIAYFVLNHVICTALLTVWGQFSPAYEIFESHNKTTYQFGAFVTFTGFANAGFTTFSDNLMSFAHHPFPLLVATYLTLAGNTAFPLFMRLIVWVLFKLAGPQDRQVYEHLLKHPRRYFTHLFLARQTWWLFVTLVIINSLQFGAFLALDWNSRAVEHFTDGDKVLNIFFHSFVTRSSGFNSVDISLLSPAVLLLYAAAMYISSTPVVVTVRTTDEDSPEVEEEVEQKGEDEAAEEQLQIEEGDDDGFQANGQNKDKEREEEEREEELQEEAKDLPLPQSIKLNDLVGPSSLSAKALRDHNARSADPFSEEIFMSNEASVRSHVGLLEENQETPGPSLGRRPTLSHLGHRIKNEWDLGLGAKITETWQAGMDTKVGQTLNHTGLKIKSEWENTIAPKITETWQAGMDTKVGQTLNHTGLKIKSEWENTIAPKITETWQAGMDTKVGQTLNYTGQKIKTTWDVGVASPLKKISRRLNPDDDLNPYKETMDDNASINNDGPLLVIPKPTMKVRTQTKLLLTQDTIILFSILFLICFIERDNLINNTQDWSIFKILFEIASGYGTCGLSIGYPGYASSFSTVWHPFCKFLIAFVMLMGRHRGLPTSIDRAIQLDIMDEIPAQLRGDEAPVDPENPDTAGTAEIEEAKRKKEQEKETKRLKKDAKSKLKLQLKEHENTLREKGLSQPPAPAEPAAPKGILDVLPEAVIEMDKDSDGEVEITYSKLAEVEDPPTPLAKDPKEKEKEREKQPAGEVVVVGKPQGTPQPQLHEFFDFEDLSSF